MSSESAVKVASSRGLLVRKILVGAGIGAGAYLIPEVLHILDSVADGGDVDVTVGVLATIGAGAAGAAIRAALALGPWNLAGPTDALHTLGRERPTTVVVDEPNTEPEVEVVEEVPPA